MNYYVTRGGRRAAFSFFHPAVFQHSPGFIADVVVHEIQHQMTTLSHCSIYRETYRITQYYHRPPTGIGQCAYP